MDELIVTNPAPAPVRPTVAVALPELLTMTGRPKFNAPVPDSFTSNATLFPPVLPSPSVIVPLVLNAFVVLTVIVPALITVPPV